MRSRCGQAWRHFGTAVVLICMVTLRACSSRTDDVDFQKDVERALRMHRRDPEAVIHRYGMVANDEEAHRVRRSSESTSEESREEMCRDFRYVIDPKECHTPNLRRYHSVDGSCNNLRRPHIGKAWLPHKRYLEPDYGDDLCSPREAAGNRTLPSARRVTNILIDDDLVFVPRLSDLTMHFGQLIDHDIGHSPVEPDKCGCDGSNENCISIPVPDDDPFFATQCIPLSRSKPVPRLDCEPGPREQVNQITAFIDASFIYGSSQSFENDLRGRRGQMRVSPNPFNASLLPLLPTHDNPKCEGTDDEFSCGRGGDRRAAVQPGLTALHTIFVRYHNKVAKELYAKNYEYWDADRVYLETRKIMSSITQHITYNEYLPITLGYELMKKYRLNVGSNSKYSGYNHNLDPTTPNVFAHAAFRMGHSQIAENLTRVDVNYKEVFEPANLRLAFFNASIVYDVNNGGIDSLMRGMIAERLLKIDRFFSHDVTRFLFGDPEDGFGLDLVAINTQRGRDHGLPGYTKWREFCDLSPVTKFEDLVGIITNDTIDLLKQAYEHVDDIDAFIGMIVEEPLQGALVGETVGCILGKTYHDLKYGDRFWYENPTGYQELMPDQRQSIRQMTMARLICDTLDEIETIQPFVFHLAEEEGSGTSSFAKYSAQYPFPAADGSLPGFNNKRVRCDDFHIIPTLDLRPWFEKKSSPCRAKEQ